MKIIQILLLSLVVLIAFIAGQTLTLPGPVTVSATVIPSGFTGMILSGSCPAGWTEVSALNGAMPYGTLAANMDVGGSGGNNNLTPSGDVSQPTFTGSALGTHLHGIGSYANAATSAGTPAGSISTPTISWPAGVPTFAGNALGTHTHTYTDVPNHVHVQNVNSATTGPLNGYGVDTSTNTPSASGFSTANPTGGVATGTTNGTSAGTPAGTISWPAGVPTSSTPTFTGSGMGTHTHTISGSSEAVSGGTPAGTVSQPTFTGNSADNRSAFIKVLFCSKD